MRRIRKGVQRSMGRLRSLTGELVCSETRCDTFGEYLEKVQWAVRPASLTEDPGTGNVAPILPMDLGPINEPELREAVRAFKPGKACGPDEVPVEYWKAVLTTDGANEAVRWLLRFVNSAWQGKKVPQSWHLQIVSMIFKKGEDADCGNYRPICLLNSAYKIFATIILRRLIKGGADDRIAASQFGFRRRRGTEDALHCARRAMELAQAHKHGRLYMLALDCRKAFD